MARKEPKLSHERNYRLVHENRKLVQENRKLKAELKQLRLAVRKAVRDALDRALTTTKLS
jgi:hypothetical protein